MKKAKIFLTALSVLAVVGGAFAFRAKQVATFARVCDIPSQTCILSTFTTTQTTTDIAPALTNYDLFGAPCKTGNKCATFTTTSL